MGTSDALAAFRQALANNTSKVSDSDLARLGISTTTPDAATSLYRQMERDLINSQGTPSTSTDTTASPSISYPDPSGMAASEFAPQFSALDAAVKQQQDRYTTSNADIASMYEALAKSTLGRTGDVRSGYDATGNSIDKAYLDAENSVSSGFNKSASNIAELLNRLGIQQAAPTALASNQQELLRSLSDLAGRSVAAKTANTTRGQNEIDYLGRTADTNRLAGKSAQTDLLKQFQALQAQNDAKRLALVAGQAQATNNYGLSISKMQQDAATSAASDQFKQAQLALDTAKFDHTVSNDAADLQLKQQQQSSSSKDPNTALSSNAYDLYGGDASAASNAVINIINAYQQSGGTSLPNMLTEIDKLPLQNTLDRDKYKQLALNFWLQMKN